MVGSQFSADCSKLLKSYSAMVRLAMQFSFSSSKSFIFWVKMISRSAQPAMDWSFVAKLKSS